MMARVAQQCVAEGAGLPFYAIYDSRREIAATADLTAGGGKGSSRFTSVRDRVKVRDWK
jgi:hypothetical protein